MSITRDATANDLGERAQIVIGNPLGTVKTVTAASNAIPIQLTVATHGYTNGALVNVYGVNGNTAANGSWTIMIVDANNFTLNGSSGNGAYTSGGSVTLNLGQYGYWFKTQPKGTPAISIKPQHARNSDATFIAADNYLTMRDYDFFSRVFITDWRHGSGQVTFDPSDKADLVRFYDSANVDVSGEGQFSLVNSMSSVYNSATQQEGRSLVQAGSYLYMSGVDRILYSTDWSGAPTAAATSSAGQVNGMTTDGQYVYAAVNGVGINQFTIGSAAAGTSWNTTSTGPYKLIYANRRIYAITNGTRFYEVALASGTGTTNLLLPTGWTLQGLCALNGGAIDSPIVLVATQGDTAATYYWDGTTIHDYVTLPVGFRVIDMAAYLGTVFITGIIRSSSGSLIGAVYSIVNGALAFVGYIGVAQANGDPGEVIAGDGAPIMFMGTAAYFYVSNSTSPKMEIWKHDLVYGGMVRWSQLSVSQRSAGAIAWFLGGPWVTNDQASSACDLLKTNQTFISSGSLTMSDLNLGQQWANNLWVKMELTFSPLADTTQAVAIAYSVDGGATFTSTDVNGTTMTTSWNGTGSKPTTVSWLISNAASGSLLYPYLRPKVTLTSGAAGATTPSFYSLSLKAATVDPSGVVLETTLACPDEGYMTGNGGPDFQGASGSERLNNIKALYEAGALVTCIYQAPSFSRAKNPQTITVRIENYQMDITQGSGFKPGQDPGLEGDVYVQLRQVL